MCITADGTLGEENAEGRTEGEEGEKGEEGEEGDEIGSGVHTPDRIMRQVLVGSPVVNCLLLRILILLTCSSVA